MARARPGRTDDAGAWLSIGALSRATGIAIETLRTWESRYGFPVPERKPSGHRVYPMAAVPRLRRVAQALALGHRAGQVVAASEGALGQLLASVPAIPAPAPPAADAAPGAAAGVLDLLELVARFEGERLRQALVADWARLGPVEFLETRVAPLVRATGEAWSSGRLEIRHEHFLSERVGSLLASLRLPFEEQARGPLVVYATLPGELHGLGLQMSALALATTGCRSALSRHRRPGPPDRRARARPRRPCRGPRASRARRAGRARRRCCGGCASRCRGGSGSSQAARARRLREPGSRW